jgi:hypothetical protein
MEHFQNIVSCCDVFIETLTANNAFFPDGVALILISKNKVDTGLLFVFFKDVFLKIVIWPSHQSLSLCGFFSYKSLFMLLLFPVC